MEILHKLFYMTLQISYIWVSPKKTEERGQRDKTPFRYLEIEQHDLF
jgi:hypothetical protein